MKNIHTRADTVSLRGREGGSEKEEMVEIAPCLFIYKRQSALLIGLILAFDINGYLCGVFITQDRNIKLLLSTPNDVCSSKMNLSDYFFPLLYFFLF